MKSILSALVLYFGLLSLPALGKTINVGGYYFPPFVEQNEELQYIGITIDLINEMNKFQSDYKFNFVATSPKRRFSAFANNEFDLIMFEDIAWDWHYKEITASDVILHGGEVYITKANKGKGQSYFDSFEDKSIAVILGYHYGFADFEANEKRLKQVYNIQFNNGHAINIKKILSDRADISIVNQSYLNNYLKLHPEVRGQLLVSEKLDQEYHHTMLLRNNAAINIEQLNLLLSSMKEVGILSKVWKKYGLE